MAANRGRRGAGKPFELAIARIQQMLDPNSIVTHNEWIVDRVGNRRQFDVVMRGVFAGRSVLGVVECKDHSRKRGPADVEAFAKKCENLGANIRLMASRKGFTPQALALARHEGLGCFSLLQGDQKSLGFSIGDYWYGVIRQWKILHLGFSPPAPEFPQSIDGNELRIGGKKVVNWFWRELLTKYKDVEPDQDMSIVLEFDTPCTLNYGGRSYEIRQLKCVARCEVLRKRKWVSWTGDALYDWHAGTFTVPPNGVITGSAVETDLNVWPDYAGEIPKLADGAKTATFLTATLVAGQKWNDADNEQVPDLESM